jgi:hypothetical protein
MSDNKSDAVIMGQNDSKDREIMERVIRRERRILHGLTGLTMILWTLSAATIVTLYALTLTYVVPIMKWTAQDQDMGRWKKMMEVTIYFGLYIGWPMVIGSAVLAVLAAVCTVFLVYWSRQATLRLVDRRLEQILAELRHPQQGA